MVVKLALNSALVAKIREHALRNYNQDGWDYLVECYSDNDIILLVAECESYEQAIAKLGRILKAKDEYRNEIRSMEY